MTTISENTGGAMTSTTFTGSGSGLTNVPRSGIAAGTANQIVVNDGSGNLSSTAILNAARGGTGIDTSSSTGFAKITAGTWSVASITASDISTTISRTQIASGTANQVVINDSSGNLSSEAQLATTRGGTGINTSASTGVAKVSAGTWSVSTIVDADVSSSAAIARTKLASGTANQVVINNGSGVMTSEAQLAVSRGGTGQDFSSIGTGPYVVSVISGVMSATVIYTTASTANTLVLRDGSGNITGNISTSTITTASGDLTLNPVGDITILDNNIKWAPTTITGGGGGLYTANVTTTNATPTTLFTLATATGTSYAIEIQITLADSTGGSNSGMYRFAFKAKNLAGTVTVSSLAQTLNIADGGLTACAVSATSSSTNILVQVTGIAATTIKWAGVAIIISQAY